MRRAFTLVELLVIVAIIGAMVTTAMISVQKGQQYAKMRGAVRDVFASVRQARSIALVSQKPCVITFSTKKVEESLQSKVEITSVKLISAKGAVKARSIGGQWRTLGVDEDESEIVAPAVDEGASSGDDSGSGGHTVEDILFEPVSEEVLSGICIKVVMADEELEGAFTDDQVKRSKLSVFSNVDFLLGNFKKEREKQQSEEALKSAKEAEEKALSPEALIAEETEEKSVAWQVNGRCEAHTIYIYPERGDIKEAWKINVDGFGAVKVEENGDGR